MTALCGGGTSAVKAGYSAVVDFGIGQLVNLLAARNLKWLVPAVPLAPIPNLTLATFCATDPPAFPTFTLAETTAVLTLTFGADFDSGISKLKDLLLYTVWNEVCQCTSGSPTAFPSGTPPAGTPIFVEPAPAQVTACDVFTFTSTACGTGNLNRGGPSYADKNFQPTSFVYNFIGTQCGTVGAGSWNWAVTQVGASGDLQTTNIGFLNPTESHSGTILAVPGVRSIRLNQNQASGPSGQLITGSTISAYCNNQTPGAQTPCCPPDTATLNTLELILQMVTLQQRQTAPFAYVPGSTHTGLTGDGEIAVSGLLGAKVTITGSLPSTVGSEAANPIHLFGAGWVQWGTADGYGPRIWLDQADTISLPDAAGAYNLLAYSLPPGLTIDVLELVREP